MQIILFSTFFFFFLVPSSSPTWFRFSRLHCVREALPVTKILHGKWRDMIKMRRLLRSPCEISGPSPESTIPKAQCSAPEACGTFLGIQVSRSPGHTPQSSFPHWWRHPDAHDSTDPGDPRPPPLGSGLPLCLGATELAGCPPTTITPMCKAPCGEAEQAPLS